MENLNLALFDVLYDSGNGSKVGPMPHWKLMDSIDGEVAHRWKLARLDAGKFCSNAELRQGFSEELLNAFGP